MTNGFKSFLAESYTMDEQKIKEAMTGSGKTKVTDLMNYMKAKYSGQYDPKLAKECAKEIVDSINESKLIGGIFHFKNAKDQDDVLMELSYEEDLDDYEGSILNKTHVISTDDKDVVDFIMALCKKEKISYTFEYK